MKTSRIASGLLALGVLSIWGFGNSASAETCTYRLGKTAPKFEWTAYKFTEKKGVTGSFDSIEVKSAPESQPSLEALLDTVHFKIETTTVQTGDPARNANIATGFFRKMMGGTVIEGDLKAGTKAKAPPIGVLLKLNGKAKLIPLTYTLAGDGTLEAKGSIDVLKMGLKTSFEFLQSLCRELHKGTDGQSKLWTTVDLKITAKVEKTCE